MSGYDSGYETSGSANGYEGSYQAQPSYTKPAKDQTIRELAKNILLKKDKAAAEKLEQAKAAQQNNK